jgi:hypothetical protein
MSTPNADGQPVTLQSVAEAGTDVTLRAAIAKMGRHMADLL